MKSILSTIECIARTMTSECLERKISYKTKETRSSFDSSDAPSIAVDNSNSSFYQYVYIAII